MSWKKIPINKIFNFEKGTLQSSKNIPGDYNFITASSEWKTHSTYSHECEALVFAMAASGSLGRTHYVNGKFIASDLCFIITPKDEYKDKVNLKFYYRYFNAIRELLVKALATGSAKLSINSGNFGKHEIIIGEIEEQNRLIEKLDFIISKRTEISEYIERNIHLSRDLKSSILQDAIHGKLVPQDQNDESSSIFIGKIQAEKTKLIAEGKLKKQKPLTPIKAEEIPYELPKGWEWLRLEYLLPDYQNGVSSRGDSHGSLITVLRLADIRNQEISFSNTREIVISDKDIVKYGIKEFDILITRVNGSADIVGQFTLSEKSIDAIYCDHFIRLRINNSWIIPKYLILVSKSSMNRRRISELFITTAGQKTVNQQHINSLLIPLPPLQEQKRIIEKIDELMKSCELLDEQVKQAKERSEKLMENVLQGVFNG